VRLGLTARVAASHVLLVVVALTIFSLVVVGVTRRDVVDTGDRVDRATAVRLAPLIEDLYRRRGSWNEVNRLLERSGHMPAMPMMQGGRMAPRPDRDVTPFLDRAVVVVDAGGVPVASSMPVTVESPLTPEDGVPLGPASAPFGWLFVGSMIRGGDNPIHAAIMGSIVRATAAAGVSVLIGALIVGALWARWLLRPIRALEAASRTLATGDYSVRVAEPAADHELRSLAQSFNSMARDVEMQEETRRRFVADAAHELRTPISLLSARIEMLRDGVYTPDGAQWDALHRSVGRIADLVADLQTLARLDAGRVALDLRRIDLSAVLEEARDQFLPDAERRGIAIEVTADTPCPASADPARLQQILTNLLSNALRHTPPRGRVDLACGDDDGGVWLTVDDSGPGVPLTQRDRVFDRFVRLDADRNREHGGSGLGLSIVRNLVTLHGGRVTVEDRPDGRSGARFLVRLPAVE